MDECNGLRERLAAMKIAQVISEYPESRAVLYSHFGASCFDCPGSKEETLNLGVRVHSADIEAFYGDLVERVSAATRSRSSGRPGSPAPTVDTGRGLGKTDS